MINRAKVIKEFELFIKEFHPACTSEGVELDMFREVLALLKEQEPVEPNVIIDTLVCGNCGTRLERQSMVGDNILVAERFEYCPICGRKVKWE